MQLIRLDYWLKINWRVTGECDSSRCDTVHWGMRFSEYRQQETRLLLKVCCTRWLSFYPPGQHLRVHHRHRRRRSPRLRIWQLWQHLRPTKWTDWRRQAEWPRPHGQEVSTEVFTVLRAVKVLSLLLFDRNLCILKLLLTIWETKMWYLSKYILLLTKQCLKTGYQRGDFVYEFFCRKNSRLQEFCSLACLGL